MDLEKLTTHQIVLLTLLVSFVTSIATGIVTVTLMDQAPPAVTNTINRVVERTVERVVPDTKGQAASVITKETTVIVKEEDLITKAIENGSKSLVRIEILQNKEESTLKYKTTALGTIVSTNGLITTDAGYIVTDGVYFARIGKERYKLDVLSQDEDLGVALLKINQEVEAGKEKSFSSISFADVTDLKLGQTVVSIGGADKDVVSMGVISSFSNQTVVVKEAGVNDKGEKVDAVTKDVLVRIDSTASASTLSGGPVLNVFGEMIGMTFISTNGTYIIPSGLVINFIHTLDKPVTTKPTE